MNLDDHPEPLWWTSIKLARVLKHLQNIKEEVDALVLSDDCGIIPDFKSEPGYLVIKAYMRKQPSPLCSIFVGEALYQMRSALDHLVCHLTEQAGNTVDTNTEFPIFLRREDFIDPDGNLTRAAERRIGGLSPENKAFIEANQPFQGRYGAPEDDPLWWLYGLANYDRHHFLHLVGFVTFDAHEEFTPQWFADRYFTRISSNFGSIEGEAEVTRFRIAAAANDADPPVRVQVNSHVSFGIAFGKEGPGAGRPVISTLRDIATRITRLLADVKGIPLPL